MLSKYRGRQSHRSRMDIITSILEFIDQKGTALKTHILYSANLNSKSLDKFLNQLIDAGRGGNFSVRCLGGDRVIAR